MKKILIVDAFGLIFRAYYALIRNPLTTSKGQPTSAIFGFWKMLFKAIKEINPQETIIALDSPQKSFRKEMYEDYKANRQETPEDLKEQIVAIVEMINNCGVPSLEYPGLEADDIISYLSQTFSKEESQIYILSSDKDLAQLVNPKVCMALPQKGVQELSFLDTEKVFEKFKVYPNQIADYLALIGDASDNVPGVPGVGPKTAEKLLSQWQNLDNIYQNLPHITPASLQERLKNNQEKAFLSKKLVELNQEYPQLNFSSKQRVWTSSVFQNLAKEFKNLEFADFFKDPFFKNLLAEEQEGVLFEVPKEETESMKPNFLDKNLNYHLVLNLDEVKKIAKKVIHKGFMAFDTETTSLDFHQAELLGLALSFQKGEAFYFPLYSENPANYTKEEFFQVFTPLFEDEKIKKIGQNLKYDIQILLPYTPIKGIDFDTMIAAWLLEPHERKYSFDNLALKYLNYETFKYKNLVKENQTLKDLPLEDVKNYACEDADITLQLSFILKELLEKNNLDTPFSQLEMPLVLVLALMEYNGIALSLDKIKELESWLEQEIAQLENQIFTLAQTTFNLNSPKQLSEVLFTTMQLPVIKKTKTGFSTNEETLEALKEYPIIPPILSYRKYSKLLSTYAKSLQKYIFNNRVHSSFHQTGTATGRLSSSDPNLQNIPIRDEAGKQVRKAFIAPNNKVLVSADYSQIELRIMAHFSEDPAMIQAFIDNKDIHNSTASLIFDILPQEINYEQRQVAKSINFGIIYGMGAYKLSKEIGSTRKEAQDFIHRYFLAFAKVKEFIEKTKEDARQKGYITTLFNRKRYLYYLEHKNRNLRESDERMAINSVIQGSSADLIKKAMISLHPSLPRFNAKLLLQIHDELVFEVEESQEKDFSLFVKNEMEKTLSLKVPLKVSVTSGKNWGDL